MFHQFGVILRRIVQKRTPGGGRLGGGKGYPIAFLVGVSRQNLQAFGRPIVVYFQPKLVVGRGEFGDEVHHLFHFCRVTLKSVLISSPKRLSYPG